MGKGSQTSGWNMEGLKVIKLYDALLTDIAPHSLTGTADMEAYALALRDAVRLILDKSEKTMFYYNFDSQEEQVIDFMAVEWRTQYYEGALEPERKRELVKNTLPWHLKAGTDGAVNGLLATMFGNGKIIPWYEYGGKPWHAQISANIEYSGDTMEKFEAMLKKVKKASTVLDEIKMQNCIQGCVHLGVRMEVEEKIYFSVPDVLTEEVPDGDI